jgi:hypothetical protein
MKLWKDMSGWPPGDVSEEVFIGFMQGGIRDGLQGPALLDYLRTQAQVVWKDMAR